MGSLAMAKREQSEIRTRRGKSAGLRSDEDLVIAIARLRDRDAFLELFNRHQQAAYNLACHISGTRTLGEEAVQEAMLRLWTSARTFRPEGNARSWLLRIVAREALRSVKGQRRHAQRAGVNLDGQPASEAAPGAGREPVDGDLLVALRGQLEQLEPAQRSMLALYFSGGLSQREIAEALEVTQQTVSNKLNETLATLRKNLAQAGFAAAAPLLGAGEIGAALDSAYEAPAGLADVLAAKLGQVADVSQRVAAAKGAGALLWAAGVLAVAAAGGAAWWLAQPAPEVKEAQAKAVGDEDAEKAAGAEDDGPLRNILWDFTKNPPKDFAVLGGAWTWKPTESGGAMEIPENGYIVLPYRPRKRPMLIESEIAILSPQKGVSFSCYWINNLPDRYIHLAREVFKNVPNVQNTPVIPIRYFVFDSYVVGVVGGELGFCSRYEKPYPGDSLVISFWNSRTTFVRLRELASEEFPEAFRVPEKLIPTLTMEHKTYPDQELMKVK